MAYLKRPITETCTGKTNPLPAGPNIVLLVLAHTGFNHEDPIIINKSSI